MRVEKRKLFCLCFLVEKGGRERKERESKRKKGPRSIKKNEKKAKLSRKKKRIAHHKKSTQPRHARARERERGDEKRAFFFTLDDDD